MNHEEIKNKLILFTYDEIPEGEKSILEEHLKNCDECKKELIQLHKLKNKIEPKISVERNFLNEARLELRSALRKEINKQSFFEKIIDALKFIFIQNYKFAFGSIAIFALGIFSGYLIFKTNLTGQNSDQNLVRVNSKEILPSDMKINNVRFIDSDASDGEIEFAFDAIKPVSVKGKVSDEKIQKILIYSMLNEQNDGIRLASLNTISNQPIENIKAEDKIKSALIKSAKFDKNPGVRREAVISLQKFNYDNEIQNALLYVIENDENAGLRIIAINSLKTENKKEKNIDEEMLRVLKYKSENDENDFIKFRAKSILSEVEQNEL